MTKTRTVNPCLVEEGKGEERHKLHGEVLKSKFPWVILISYYPTGWKGTHDKDIWDMLYLSILVLG